MRTVEFSFPVRVTPGREQMYAAAAAAVGVAPKNLERVEVLRRSLDARGRDMAYRYRADVYLKGEQLPPEPDYLDFKDVRLAEPVIIVGAGPAGLFAALRCLREGLRPIILERGADVHKRKYDIAAISRQGHLDPESNYCFGEGGAGTFSDGKLYTRSNKRGDVREVLRQLIHFGADESIMTDAHPHIGSDRLPRIMENLRHCIEEHGGEYHFSTRVTDLERRGGGWRVLSTGGQFETGSVILATGHSARDIYSLFDRRGWTLEAKGFALGVRAEHPQQLINDIQYHGRYAPYLPPAEYSLVTQVEGRGVFSFCMCPGGILVPSSTEPGTVVLNGMSNSLRNGPRANAGIVVSVEPEDVERYDIAGGNDLSLPMKMLEFQESVERRAFEATGSFKAPAQRMTDFVRSKPGGKCILSSLPASSYLPGVAAIPLDEILPYFVASRLRAAFPLFDRKMHGYYTEESLLLAVESRTSSPVRIPRDPVTLEYISAPGLYPCGEGAGYSGGIVSSAIDGIRCAEKIALRSR